MYIQTETRPAVSAFLRLVLADTGGKLSELTKTSVQTRSDARCAVRGYPRSDRRISIYRALPPDSLGSKIYHVFEHDIVDHIPATRSPPPNVGSIAFTTACTCNPSTKLHFLHFKAMIQGPGCLFEAVVDHSTLHTFLTL